MSKSRIAMLIVLLLLTICAFVVLGFTIAKRFPGYYWTRAEAAFENEQYEDAFINLQKLLHRYPDHDRGHELMARVILNDARQKGLPSSYLANPAATEHLARAVELRPGDMNLKRLLLRAYLQNPNLWGKAATIAQEVHKIDPKDPDAHFALTWHAVERKDQVAAEALFATFADIKSTHVFETMALQAKLYWELEDEEKADAVMDDAQGLAELLNGEQLGLLTARDRERMLALLLAYQDRAKDPAEALKRAKAVIDACFKLDEAELMDKRWLANAAAQSIALFNMRFPPLRTESAHELLRDELAARVEKLGAGALDTVAQEDDLRDKRLGEIRAEIAKVESDLAVAKGKSEIKPLQEKLAALQAEEAAVAKQFGVAPMLVYWNTARTLMARGQYDEALKVLDDGLVAAEKLGDRIGNQHLDLHLLAARVLIMQRRFPEANTHLDELIGNPRFEGWSHLLKGSVALHEGRLDDAHTQFLQAKQSMGDKILVRMSLARTHMAREEWEPAIALLESLQVPEETLSDEEKAWHQQLLGGGDRVEFDLLRAQLALGQWDAAKDRLRVLRDANSELAPGAYGMAITFLWDESKATDDRPRAKQYLEAARKIYSDDLSLALLDARILKEEGESAKAAKVIEDFAAAKPEDELRQLALARWQIRNKQPEQALTTLNRLEGISDLSDKARNTLMVYRVQALLGNRQVEQAQAQCDLLLANEGTETAGYLFKASIAFMQRNEQVGVDNLEKALASNPRNQALKMMLAKIREAQGDYSGVLDEITDLAGVAKYQTQVQTTVSDTLRKIAASDGPEKALAEADKMLAKRPGDLALRVLKVDFLLKLDRFDEAMRELAEAERRSPTDPNIPRLKAQAYLIKREHANALVELEKALKLDAQNVDLQAMAAEACIGTDRINDAIKHARAAVQLDPNAPRGYLLLAECFRKSQPPNLDNAIKVLQIYAQRRPNDYAIHETIANLYRENGDPDGAIAQLQRARFAQPNDIRYIVRELEVLLTSNRQSEARLLANEKAGQSKKPYEILLVAQAFAAADQFADAQQWGARALSVAGDSIDQRAAANSFLGRIYLKQGSVDGSNTMREKARDYFQAVLNDQPSDLIAANNLAWLLAVHLNQPQEAVKVVENVQKKNRVGVEQLPVEFVDTMAVVYTKAGQGAKAQTILKQALAKNPRSAPLLYQLGLSLVDGQPAQAKEMLSRAVELGLSAEDEAEAKRQLARL